MHETDICKYLKLLKKYSFNSFFQKLDIRIEMETSYNVTLHWFLSSITILCSKWLHAWLWFAVLSITDKSRMAHNTLPRARRTLHLIMAIL